MRRIVKGCVASNMNVPPAIGDTGWALTKAHVESLSTFCPPVQEVTTAVCKDASSGDVHLLLDCSPEMRGWAVRSISFLGQGGYGTICRLVRHNPEKPEQKQREVAVKQMVCEDIEQLDLALRECYVGMHFRHRNLVTVHECWHSWLVDSDREHIAIQVHMEVMGMSLSALLTRDIHKEVNIEQVDTIMRQACLGLQFLHGRGYVHGDIKPHNILLDERAKVAKLCDFGLATNASVLPRGFTIITVWYRPPELLLRSRRVRASVDIWSMGCVLAEMLRRRVLLPCRWDPKDATQTDQNQLAMIQSVLGAPTRSEHKEMCIEARVSEFEELDDCSYDHCWGPKLHARARDNTYYSPSFAKAIIQIRAQGHADVADRMRVAAMALRYIPSLRPSIGELLDGLA